MNELVVIQKTEAMDIFTNRELITPLLEKIKHVATIESFDVTCAKGRQAIASMAYRVAQSKTYIEEHGKELASELKELPKLVDANRKYARDFLDNLKEEVRSPLTRWELEQERIKLLEKIEADHEIALLDNIEWALTKKAEQERLDKERADYEAKVFAEAEARAKIVAEEKSRREIIEAEARVIAAENEMRRKEAQAKIDIEHAQIRAEKQARDTLEKEQRVIREQEEINRQEKCKKENVDKVHQSIKDNFLSIGLNEKQAAYLLKAICAGKIKALTIEY